MKTIFTICSALLLSMSMINITYAGNCGGTPCIKSVDIIDGSILSKDLAPKTVSGAQIRNGAVFPNKLAASAKPAGVAALHNFSGLLPAGTTNNLGTATTVASVTLTAPGAGFVIVSFSGVCEASGHVSPNNDGMPYALTTNITYVPDTGFLNPFVWFQALPTGNRLWMTCAQTKMFPVAAAGAQTYYLRASTFGIISGIIRQAELTAAFVPAAY